jgi:hypothetical protein
MLTVTTRLSRGLPDTDVQSWTVFNADAVRMLSSTRHALKYHHLVACLPEQLPTGSYCRSYSKSTATSAVSKPTITKKKYSELPALHPPCQTIPNVVLGSETASNTHHARHPPIRECASLPHCMLSVNIAVCSPVIHSWDFELIFD